MISSLRLIAILALLFIAAPLFGQRLHVSNVDASAFPTVRAKVFLEDRDHRWVNNLTASDFRVTEGGASRTVRSIACPPRLERKISLAISIDNSGSMNCPHGTVGHPVTLAIATARALAERLDLPPSEAAVQSSSGTPFIHQDFTTSRDKVLRAIDRVGIGSGDNFHELLLNSPMGILNIAATGRYKRVAIVLTDAWEQQLSNEDLAACKDLCARYDITFYAVIYSVPSASSQGVKNSLRELANATGGMIFDEVLNESAALDIALNISKILSGAEPCEIAWESDRVCAPVPRTAIVSVPSLGVSSTVTYSVPGERISRIESAPQILSYGGLPAGSGADLTTTITMRNMSGMVRTIRSTDPRFTIIDYGGSPPPFTLGDGESRTLRVRFTAADSGYAFGRIEMQTDLCTNYLIMQGGYAGVPPSIKTLRLTHPNGGEVFAVGIDTVITWEGIAPTDSVRLEYSIDAGATWRLITDAATGLRYPWTVPPTPSFRCLARATQLSRGMPSDSDLARNAIVLPGHNDAVRFLAWSPDGSRLAAVGDDTLRIWDPYSGTLYLALAGHAGVVLHCDWSPDGRRIVTGSTDRTAKIWDALTGELLVTLGGPVNFGAAFQKVKFSPDGRRVAVVGDQVVLVFDAVTGAQLARMGSSLGGVEAMWTRDGSRVIVAGFDDFVYVWDGVSPSYLYRSERLPASNFCAALDPTETTVAAGGYASAAVVDVATGKMTPLEPRHTMAVSSVSWTPDGSRLLTTGQDGEIKIWDASNWSLLLSYTGHGTIVNAGAYGPGGALVGSVGNRMAKIWDAATGTDLRQLVGHTSYIGSIAWSPNGARIATGSTDQTVRVWSLQSGVQSDLSDSLWAIVKPEVAALDVDLGTVLVNTSRDSVVSALVTNTGTIPAVIEEIRIEGGAAGDFMRYFGNPPRTILPGKVLPVEFRFHPTAVGPRVADLVISVGGDTLRRTIRGVGVAPMLSVQTPIIDFGTIDVETVKDTVAQGVLMNIGSVSVDITDTRMLGPDADQFEIIGGGGAFTLAPGEVRTMSLRFDPSLIGRTSGRIGFDYDGLGSPAIAVLFGKAVGGTVYIPDDSAAAGERIAVTLRLRGKIQNRLVKGGQRFNARVRVRQALLAPEGGEHPVALKDGYREIAIDGVWDGASDTLITIPMRALLGDVEQCGIDLLDFDWVDDNRVTLNAATQIEGGTFTLLDICREGGSRLYDEAGVAVALKVTPNPAAESFEVEYALAEDGRISIELFDIAGARAEKIIEGERAGGTYRERISSDHLSSGAYLLILRTPTQVVTRRIEVKR